MTTDKRAERRRKRRKGAAAGRPTNYSQLYKDDNTIERSKNTSSSNLDAGDGSDNGSSGFGSGEGIDTKKALSGSGTESIDWQGEYHHVFGDLRLVLLVSVLIFAAMFIAGYFL